MKNIVVITRQKEEAVEFLSALGEAFECILFPVIQIVGPKSWEACDTELDRLSTYDGIIFTSVNAVKYFMRRVFERGEREGMQLMKAYAVGEKTKDALLEAGVKSESLPEDSTSEGLAEHILKVRQGIKRMLFPKGDLAENRMEKRLKENGIEVKSLVVYRNIKATITEEEKAVLKDKLQSNAVKIVTFFSPSAVRNFFDEAGWVLSCDKVSFAAIGPTTEKTLKQRGITVSIVPPTSTAVALAEAIKEFMGKGE